MRPNLCGLVILAAVIGEERRPVWAGFLEEVPNGAKLK